jgi:hypothetical protein
MGVWVTMLALGKHSAYALGAAVIPVPVHPANDSCVLFLFTLLTFSNLEYFI